MKPLGAQFSTYISALMCNRCGERFAPRQALFTCMTCGPDDGLLDVEFDLAAVNRDLAWSDLVNAPPTHWRYGPLLPLAPHHLGENWPIGMTPLFEAPVLAQACRAMRLLLKDDGRNPTQSVYDRSASVAAIRAAEAGAKAVAMAADNVAGRALAAWAAAAAVPAILLVPHDQVSSDMAAAQFGATVIRVRASFAEAARLCREACDQFGWYNAQDGDNPYLAEGRKTLGLEIAEQCLTDPPDVVAVPSDDPFTVLALAKGLKQMRALELIDWFPKLLGVGPSEPHPRVRQVLTESDGAWVVVDANCAEEFRSMAALRSGLAMNRASAGMLAGVHVAIDRGLIGRRSTIVACITGRGEALPAPTNPVRDIEPTLENLRRIVERSTQR